MVTTPIYSPHRDHVGRILFAELNQRAQTAWLHREYRNKHYQDTGQPLPAQHALGCAREHLRGAQLIADANLVWQSTGYVWSWEIGPYTIDIRQEWMDGDCSHGPDDDEGVTSWDEVPEHQDYGMVGRVIDTATGRELFEDSCWGFEWDWPEYANELSIAHAWDHVGVQVVDWAEKAAGGLSDYTRQLMAVRADA